MRSIILAAGVGSRLKPLTDNSPKCLTEVNGKSILINMLNNLKNSGILQTRIVVGYLGKKIKERIGDNFKGMSIDYVKNKDYNKTNTSYSLLKGLKGLDEEILILEGDIFFEEKLLREFLRTPYLNSTAVQKYNPHLDGSFVEIKNNLVVDWIHKTARDSNFQIQDKYKTVNIHKFSADFVRTILKPGLEKHVNLSEGTEPLEYVMQDIVLKKIGIIHPFEVGSLKWFEIDNIEDLKLSEKIFK